MYKIEFGFKVSMNEEERKAGNSHELKGLTMTFTPEQVEKALEKAVSSEVIAIQANIKAHWTEFLQAIKDDTFPKELTFGDRPFATGRKTYKATKEDVKAHCNKMLQEGASMEEVMEWLNGNQ